MQPSPPPVQHPPHPQYAPPPKKRMGCGTIFAIAAAVAVPLLGILFAVAVPAFSKFVRRSKAAEARAELARLFAAVASYHAEHGHCPGNAGVTPPPSTECADEGGRCTPGSDYPAAAWSDNEAWSALGFDVTEQHRFHYDVRWTQDPAGPCMFTVQAFGDLDDDGQFSTYERVGIATAEGTDRSGELTIVDDLE
ncbi:MAG: hypothetical protein AAGA54_31455 [Myxococcota bacterium]